MTSDDIQTGDEASKKQFSKSSKELVYWNGPRADEHIVSKRKQLSPWVPLAQNLRKKFAEWVIAQKYMAPKLPNSVQLLPREHYPRMTARINSMLLCVIRTLNKRNLWRCFLPCRDKRTWQDRFKKPAKSLSRSVCCLVDWRLMKVSAWNKNDRLS